MDLFDQLKTAGPVDKGSNKKSSSSSKDLNTSSNKKNLSPDKHVEASKKHTSVHRKEETSYKKSSSSHGKETESDSKKKSLSPTDRGVEKNKKNISNYKEEKPSKNNSTHGNKVEDKYKKNSTPNKDNHNNSKKISNHGKDVSPQKNHDHKVAKLNVNKHKTHNDTNSSTRRESLPTSLNTHGVTSKKKSDKSSSLSPSSKSSVGLTKSFKIKLDRKNVQEILDHSGPHDSSAVKSKKHDKQKETKLQDKNKESKQQDKNKGTKHQDKHKETKQQDKYKETKQQDKVIKQQDKHKETKHQDKHKETKHQDKVKETKQPDKQPKESKEPKKMTPTKAQQKLFEPVVRQKKTKAQLLKEFNVKPCIVRIHRDNFKKLIREFKKNKSSPPIKPIKISKLALGVKRPADHSPSTKNDGPPAKKGKLSSPPKLKTNFFIKLNTPKLDKSKSEKSKVDKFKSKLSSKLGHKITSSSVAQHNKIKNSKFSASTTPTKFSRSHLISSFGKRWFKSYVRVEKCGHPLMLTFESNARARLLQTKHNKSKNLSVSFREQVEVFGGSSDSDDSYDENFCPTTSRNGAGRRVNSSNYAIPVVPVTPVVVMPARLKKVENGKVVDDILLDPALFLDPQHLVASTPYSPGRKKRDHKSFSPLKDEGSPSPRKEQLKLANERVPPSGLRRLNMEEDDDDDDDCEYIVPIELPQRRGSRTSSTNTVDGGPAPTMNKDGIFPHRNSSAMLTDIDEAIALAKRLVSPGTIIIADTDSDAASKGDATTNSNNIDSDQTESHESFVSANDLDNRPNSESPSLALNDVLNHVDTNNISELNGNIGNTNVNNSIVGDLTSINDMSMNLFIEDSETNDDCPEKSFVDSIINETIDKLGKDIGCDDNSADDQQYRNAI